MGLRMEKEERYERGVVSFRKFFFTNTEPIREFGSAVVKATVSTVDPSLVCLHATRVIL